MQTFHREQRRNSNLNDIMAFHLVKISELIRVVILLVCIIVGNLEQFFINSFRHNHKIRLHLFNKSKLLLYFLIDFCPNQISIYLSPILASEIIHLKCKNQLMNFLPWSQAVQHAPQLLA